MARSYSERLASVRAMLADGFTTKSGRNDAMAILANAYEAERKLVMDSLLSEKQSAGWDWLKEPESWRIEYDSFPYSLAHWRAAKHGKIYARFPDAVAKANECAALRETVKAAPLVEKKPRPKTEKELKREAESKECQICGRPIFAEVGLIAHHGYTRPGDGWQTASCWGARELPYENSRDVLGQYVKALGRGLFALEVNRGNCCHEAQPIRVSWEGEQIKQGESGYRPGRFERHKHEVEFTRATFDSVTHSTPEAVKYFHESCEAKFSANIAGQFRSGFDFWKFRELLDYDRRIEHQWYELNRQRKRFADWKRTHEYNAARETWEAV